jgi:ribosomal-protein-alanine N-acetyltransferase
LSTNPTIAIRVARSGDVPALMNLERRSSTSAHWSEGHYQNFFSDDQKRLVLVGESVGSGNPVAFLVAHRIADEWELENIVVSPAEQRRGIGTELLAALIARSRKTGSTAVFLEVRASNAGARALYEKVGFQETGWRKSYYQNPLEDAVLYRLDLS